MCGSCTGRRSKATRRSWPNGHTVQSRAGYFLAPIFLLAGVAVAVWLGWSEYNALQNALTRMVVPGATELVLDKPGTYTIYHEAESVVDGRLYSVQSIPGLAVTVTAEAGGKTVPVVVPGISSKYTMGSHSGVSILAFTIAEPGRYRLTADYGGHSGPQTVLAIGQEFIWSLLRTIFGAIAAGLAGFGAALALVLTTYFRRRRMQPLAG
jgi:hypothetical protein